MADLHYFPLLAGDWLAGEAISLMTPEQEGAFIHLLCHCWNTNPPPSIHARENEPLTSGKLPCTLPNDDRALAQLSRLGRRWKSAGALVRQQFVEVDGDPTRIYNPKLWEIYQEALAAHDRRVAAGKAGGEAKARRYQSPSNATAMPKHSPSSQNQSHITTTTPAGEKREEPPPTPPVPVVKPKPKRGPVTLSPDAQRVWDFYKALHPRAQVDEKLAKRINARLQSYTPDDLCHAIQGCHEDSWHASVGKTDLEYILRDNNKVTLFLSKYDATNAPLVGEDGQLTDAGRRYFAQAAA